MNSAPALAPFQRHRGQPQGGGPAFGFAIERGQIFIWQRDLAPLGQEFGGLFGGKTQLVGVDLQ